MTEITATHIVAHTSSSTRFTKVVYRRVRSDSKSATSNCNTDVAQNLKQLNLFDLSTPSQESPESNKLELVEIPLKDRLNPESSHQFRYTKSTLKIVPSLTEDEAMLVQERSRRWDFSLAGDSPRSHANLHALIECVIQELSNPKNKEKGE